MSGLILGPMAASDEHAYLAELESRVAAGEEAEVEASLALLAGRDVELDEDELRGALRPAVEDLPEIRSRLERLAADEELAWRWFACTLLAEEIEGEPE